MIAVEAAERSKTNENKTHKNQTADSPAHAVHGAVAGADDGGYGPSWAPRAAQVARRGWSPTFICESAGTQAKDALTMKRIYQEVLTAQG